MQRLRVHHLLLGHETEAHDHRRELLVGLLLLREHGRELCGGDEAFGEEEVGQPAADLGLTVADVGARSGDARVAIAAVAVAIGRRRGNGRARRFPGRVVGRALEIH